MKNAKDFCPKNKNEWRKWLASNHTSNDGVWLIFYKKKSPNFNLSWSDSVDEALCFGWIDSTKRTIDEQSYKQYFSQRKDKSNWSKVNKEKVQSLIDQGWMEEPGFKSIAIAKENGSWTLLDDVEDLVIPEELRIAFEKQPESLAYFESLSKSVKKMLLYWVISAKRIETRQKRIAEIVEHAHDKTTPKQFR